MTTTERAALVVASPELVAVEPQLTPLERAEHLLNTILGDLSTAEAQLNKLDEEATFDAVLHLWGARKQLRNALEEVQKIAE